MNATHAWPAPDVRCRVLSKPPQEVTRNQLQLRGLVFSQQDADVVEVCRSGGQDAYQSQLGPSQTYYIDGICTPWNRQQSVIADYLQGQSPDGVKVEGAVRGIQQGGQDDFKRESLKIGKVLLHLKLAQAGIPMKWLSKRIYRCDPAVRSLHDELKVALDRGQKFTVMTHSGGGAEAAAALTILASEGYADRISQQARVLSLASACSAKDFELAGIDQKNLFYSGSNRDYVHKAFRDHLTFHGLPFNKTLWTNLYHAATEKSQTPHEVAYLFSANQKDSKIRNFLEGGAGSHHSVD